MMPALWLALALGATPLSSAEAPGPAARVVEVSAGFLGTPYVVSPLGEGEGQPPDPDPLLRYDAVDCLTFVEQTLALALAQTPAQVGPLLERIRYDGGPRYERRHHLMEAQWIPGNLRAGVLRDVTSLLAPGATVRADKTLDDRSWTGAGGRALGLSPKDQPRGRFPLEIIPLPEVGRIARAIPTGTVLVVVRSEHPRRVTRVTHLGFVVQKGKKTFLRHASRTPFGRVVDEELAAFLARNRRYDRWPVVGVTLLEPTAPPAARVAGTGGP